LDDLFKFDDLFLSLFFHPPFLTLHALCTKFSSPFVFA